MLSIERSIVGLFIASFLLFMVSSPVQAEEVGVQYQVLGNQQGSDTTTTTFILELWNLSGNDLNNLTIDQSILSPSLPDEGEVNIGTLTTADSKMITVSFTIPNAYLSSDNGTIRFYVSYETADGIPRSAILQGQPTVFIGNPIP